MFRVGSVLEKRQVWYQISVFLEVWCGQVHKLLFHRPVFIDFFLTLSRFAKILTQWSIMGLFNDDFDFVSKGCFHLLRCPCLQFRLSALMSSHTTSPSQRMVGVSRDVLPSSLTQVSLLRLWWTHDLPYVLCSTHPDWIRYAYMALALLTLRQSRLKHARYSECTHSHRRACFWDIFLDNFVQFRTHELNVLADSIIRFRSPSFRFSLIALNRTAVIWHYQPYLCSVRLTSQVRRVRHT